MNHRCLAALDLAKQSGLSPKEEGFGGRVRRVVEKERKKGKK